MDKFKKLNNLLNTLEKSGRLNEDEIVGLRRQIKRIKHSLDTKDYKKLKKSIEVFCKILLG